MIPSSPNLRPNSSLSNAKTLIVKQNDQNTNQIISANVNTQTQKQSIQETSLLTKNFQINLTNVMKNNEDYEMNLASNCNVVASSAQREIYSQSQRSLMQNPMILNPDQFNEANIKGSKMNEIANCNPGVSQEKLKDVIL